MSSPPSPSPAVLYRPLLLASFGFTFLTFGLPIYSKALGASALEIGGLYAIFTAVLLVLRPAVGWGVDRFGRRRFLIAALLGYSASMLAFALATDLAGFYLARLLQGIASSLMWVTVFTVVADLANPHDRGRVMGRVNESTSRGEIIGVVLGFGMLRLLGNQNGWVVSFLVYAGLALVAAWLAWKKVPETRPPTSPQTSPGRVVPPGMLRLMVVVFATGFGMGLISPIYMVYLQDKFTTDISLLAWAFFPAGILYTVLPSRMGGLSDRVGRAPLMAGGLAVAGAISFFLPGVSSLLVLALLYTLSTVGWTMADPAEAAMVADLTGGDVRGRGYGLYQFAANLGATLGPLLGGWLYDSTAQAAPFYANGAILMAGALWVILFLRRRPA